MKWRLSDIFAELFLGVLFIGVFGAITLGLVVLLGPIGWAIIPGAFLFGLVFGESSGSSHKPPFMKRRD